MTLPPHFYRIGVIADTHNRWHSRASGLLEGVDEIWHLGDICKESILDEARSLCSKVEVVLGNNDFDLDYPLCRTLERKGKKFYLIHIFPIEIPQGIDFLCYGHTHRPDQSKKNGVECFNPGSVGNPNKGAPASLGFLEYDPIQGWSSRIVLL
jgi:uncharacterized protein